MVAGAGAPLQYPYYMRCLRVERGPCSGNALGRF